MEIMQAPNLVALFLNRAESQGAKPFLWRHGVGGWNARSFAEVEADVRALASGLASLGLKPGERVVLVAENRPEWLIADLAIMGAGGITTPAYITNTIADHLHIINNSGARLVIVSTEILAERVVAAAARAVHPPTIITIENLKLAQNPGVAIFSWDGVLAKGRAAPDVLDGFAQSLKRFDTACIIHTSGTGGAPKGVMLSHGAILHNCSGARKLLLELGLADEVFLSFLPLSHSYEHTAGMFFPLSIGAQIYYADGADQLGAFMVETRPTIMTAVPRLYEMMRGRILRGLAREKGLKVKLFHRAVELGTKKILNPNSLTFSEKMENLLLDLLVRSKVKARFGGRLKAMVSGGAPLNPEVGLFFSSLGVPVLQGYGQTESAPVISCNPPSRPKMHTVGPVLEEVTVKIAEDGEILVQGELVMQGYWNDSEADTQVLKDGWLHTGDIGEFDEDGYLRITDRKKDIIVNSGGDNVAPQRVEGLLTLEPEIGQAMVHGDKRPHLVALIVPDGEFAQSWAKERGLPLDLAALAEMAEFRKAIGTAIERVNTGLSNIEKVRRFTLLPAPFSVDNGMMTPTLKVRRHKIREAYGEMLEGMYG